MDRDYTFGTPGASNSMMMALVDFSNTSLREMFFGGNSGGNGFAQYETARVAYRNRAPVDNKSAHIKRRKMLRG
ncbi:MAG: hypothetical protein ABH864_06840 [archaeon]